jgi:DNA-binding FadR family transcriptional regulator
MREIIEPAAAAAAARRRLDHHLRQLQNALKAMEQASDRNAWTEADVDFHEAILNATGNDLLASLFAVIETALSSYFTLSAHSASDFKYSLPHHEKVYQAIRKQQPEAARRAMQRIISDSRTNMENVD